MSNDKFTSFNAKLKVFKDQTNKLFFGSTVLSSSGDFLSNLKFFQNFLQNILKDTINIDKESYGNPQYVQEFRLNRLPTLPYEELFDTLTNLLENSVKFNNNANIGEHIIKTYHALIPFLNLQSLDGLPYIIASSLIYLHNSLQQNVMEFLCSAVIPLVYSCIGDRDSYAMDSIPSIMTIVFQHVDKREYHSWLLESFLSIKKELYKDLFMVIAYGPTEARIPATVLLFHYWPELCPAAFQNHIELSSFQHYTWEPWKPVTCERSDCPSKIGKAIAMKMTIEPKAAAKHANKPPPLYVCLDCADALNRRDFDKLFDVSLPSKSINNTCDIKTCNTKNNTATVLCNSIGCTFLNGYRPIRLCESCHIQRHSNNSSYSAVRNKLITPLSNNSSTLSMLPRSDRVELPVTSSQTHNLINDHIYQTPVVDVWNASLDLQPMIIEAIVAISCEYNPIWKQMLSNRTLPDNEIIKIGGQSGPGGPGHTELSPFALPSQQSIQLQQIPNISGNQLANDITNNAGKQNNSEISSLMGESEVVLNGKYSDEEHRLISLYAIFLIGEKCKVIEKANPVIMIRLTATIYNWFSDSSTPCNDELSDLIEKIKSEYIIKWLQEVLHTYLEAPLSVLLPHPVEFARVGIIWEALNDQTFQVKQGLIKIAALIPYDLITFEIWNYMIPYWLEAIHAEVPPENYRELDINLKKIFDPTAGPFPFLPSKLYNFATERFKGTSIPVIDQVITWLEILTHCELIIPMKELMGMFRYGVESMIKDPSYEVDENSDDEEDNLLSEDCEVGSTDIDEILSSIGDDRRISTSIDEMLSNLNDMQDKKSQSRLEEDDQHPEPVQEEKVGILRKFSKSPTGSINFTKPGGLFSLATAGSLVGKVKRRKSNKPNSNTEVISLQQAIKKNFKKAEKASTISSPEKKKMEEDENVSDNLKPETSYSYRITNCLTRMVDITFRQLRIQDPDNKLMFTQETYQSILALISDMIFTESIQKVSRSFRVEEEEDKKTTERNESQPEVNQNKSLNASLNCNGNCTCPAPVKRTTDIIGLTDDQIIHQRKNQAKTAMRPPCLFCSELYLWFEIVGDICQHLTPTNKMMNNPEKFTLSPENLRNVVEESQNSKDWRGGSDDPKSDKSLSPTKEDLQTFPPLLRLIYQFILLIKSPEDIQLLNGVQIKKQDPVITKSILLSLNYLIVITKSLSNIFSNENKSDRNSTPGSTQHTPLGQTNSGGQKKTSSSSSGVNTFVNISTQAKFTRYLIEDEIVPTLWNLLTTEFSHLASWTVPLLMHMITLPRGFKSLINCLQKQLNHVDWRIRLCAVEKIGIINRIVDENILSGSFNGAALSHIAANQPINTLFTSGFSFLNSQGTLLILNVESAPSVPKESRQKRTGGKNRCTVNISDTSKLTNVHPIIMTTIAHTFSNLIGALDDVSTIIYQHAAFYLNNISNRSMTNCIRCLEFQFDCVPRDRTLILQKIDRLATTLTDRAIFNWDFFINRFGLLAIEAQLNDNPKANFDTVTDLNNANRNSDTFKQQYLRAEFAQKNEGDPVIFSSLSDDQCESMKVRRSWMPNHQELIMPQENDFKNQLNYEKNVYRSANLDPILARNACMADISFSCLSGGNEKATKNLQKTQSNLPSSQPSKSSSSAQRFSLTIGQNIRNENAGNNFDHQSLLERRFGARRVPPKSATYNGHINYGILNDSEFLDATNRFLNSIQNNLDFAGKDRSTLHYWVTLLLRFMSDFELEVHYTQNIQDFPDTDFSQTSNPLNSVGGYRGVRAAATRNELKDKKSLSKVIRHLSILLGYTDQTFNIPPYKMRASTAFQAYICEIPRLLDKNFPIGNCIINQTLRILQFCPSPQRFANDSQPPNFTLRLLEPITRVCWIQALLVILYKYDYKFNEETGINPNTPTELDPAGIDASFNSVPNVSAVNSGTANSSSNILQGNANNQTKTSTASALMNIRYTLSYLLRILINTLNAQVHECPEKTSNEDTKSDGSPEPAIISTFRNSNVSNEYRALTEIETPNGSSESEGTAEKCQDIPPCEASISSTDVSKTTKQQNDPKNVTPEDKKIDPPLIEDATEMTVPDQGEQKEEKLITRSVSITSERNENKSQVRLSQRNRSKLPESRQQSPHHNTKHQQNESELKKAATLALADVAFEKCPFCLQIIEEYDETTLGLCIVCLSTVVHNDPELAAPLLIDMMMVAVKIINYPLYSWNINLPYIIVPGNVISITRQFLRSLFYKLSPNGIFNILMITPIKHDNFFKVLASVMVDFEENMTPFQPLTNFFDNFNKSKVIEMEKLPILLENLALYFENLPGLSDDLKMNHFIVSGWNEVTQVFDGFLRKLTSLSKAQIPFNFSTLMRIFLFVLKSPAAPNNKGIVETFCVILRMIIETNRFHLDILIEICLVCCRTFKERTKSLITKTVIDTICQTIKFKVAIPDENIIKILQFLLMDAGSTIEPNQISFNLTTMFNPQTYHMYSTGASDAMRSHIFDVIQFLCDVQSNMKLKQDQRNAINLSSDIYYTGGRFYLDNSFDNVEGGSQSKPINSNIPKHAILVGASVRQRDLNQNTQNQSQGPNLPGNNQLACNQNNPSTSGSSNQNSSNFNFSNCPNFHEDVICSHIKGALSQYLAIEFSRNSPCQDSDVLCNISPGLITDIPSELIDGMGSNQVLSTKYSDSNTNQSSGNQQSNGFRKDVDGVQQASSPFEGQNSYKCGVQFQSSFINQSFSSNTPVANTASNQSQPTVTTPLLQTGQAQLQNTFILNQSRNDSPLVHYLPWLKTSISNAQHGPRELAVIIERMRTLIWLLLGSNMHMALTRNVSGVACRPIPLSYTKIIADMIKCVLLSFPEQQRNNSAIVMASIHNSFMLALQWTIHCEIAGSLSQDSFGYNVCLATAHDFWLKLMPILMQVMSLSDDIISLSGHLLGVMEELLYLNSGLLIKLISLWSSLFTGKNKLLPSNMLKRLKRCFEWEPSQMENRLLSLYMTKQNQNSKKLKKKGSSQTTEGNDILSSSSSQFPCPANSLYGCATERGSFQNQNKSCSGHTLVPKTPKEFSSSNEKDDEEKKKYSNLFGRVSDTNDVLVNKLVIWLKRQIQQFARNEEQFV